MAGESLAEIAGLAVDFIQKIMTTNDADFHEQQAEEMLEWYKSLTDEEQERFDKDIIGMLAAFTQYMQQKGSH